MECDTKGMLASPIAHCLRVRSASICPSPATSPWRPTPSPPVSYPSTFVENPQYGDHVRAINLFGNMVVLSNFWWSECGKQILQFNQTRPTELTHSCMYKASIYRVNEKYLCCSSEHCENFLFFYIIVANNVRFIRKSIQILKPAPPIETGTAYVVYNMGQ